MLHPGGSSDTQYWCQQEYYGAGHLETSTLGQWPILGLETLSGRLFAAPLTPAVTATPTLKFHRQRCQDVSNRYLI